MGLFSLNDLLLENGNSEAIDIDNIGYVDTAFSEHSYVQDGYDFILETTRFFNEAERTFCSRIRDSYGDDTIITESFGENLVNLRLRFCDFCVFGGGFVKKILILCRFSAQKQKTVDA